MSYFEWTNQKRCHSTSFCLQNVCSVCWVCFHRVPAPDPACCLAGAGAGPSAVTVRGPALSHLHPRSVPRVLCNSCPGFFFSRDPESETWVRMGREQHVLSLSVFNRRMVCPGQLMGTRTCRAVHPPHSAAAVVSEPAGASRSRAAPCQPSSQGQL